MGTTIRRKLAAVCEVYDMKQYKLFIDESGKPHPNHPSKYFIQIGCLVENSRQNELKILLDQIKFKYWGNTAVVFHSEAIGKGVGQFTILKNPEIRKKFEKDLFKFLNAAPFQLIVRLSDKHTMIGWKPETILSRSTEGVFTDFIALLFARGDSRGRIVFEASSFDQDKVYLQSFTKFLYPSWESKNPEFSNVREKLTSVTFATKLNHDSEIQLADLFAYAAICKLKKSSLQGYEKLLVEIFDRKLVKAPPNVSDANKKKYYEKLKGYEIIKGIDKRKTA